MHLRSTLSVSLFLAVAGMRAAYANPGELYVSDQTDKAIVRYNANGLKNGFAPNTTSAGLIFDAKGNLFAADNANGVILKFTPNGLRSTFASGFTLPTGITINGAGELFVTELFAGTITKISPTGTKTPFASGLNLPSGLAADRAGNIYEADFGSGKVNKITPAGGATVFASGMSANGPYALAIDASGNVFVSDVKAGNVYKITPAGVRTLFVSNIGAPEGLAFDASGNLFVADNGSPSALLLFTPSGQRTTFAGGPGVGAGSPTFIAFEPTLHNLLNISTRGFVNTGDSALIAGFIVGGNGQADCTVIARALGPSLAASGVPTPLADPTLEIHDSSGTLVARNNDWKTDQQAELVATGIQPTNDRESALITHLTAGSYTAVVKGVNSTTGNALVEVYNTQ